jgi:hypothetical protein
VIVVVDYVLNGPQFKCCTAILVAKMRQAASNMMSRTRVILSIKLDIMTRAPYSFSQLNFTF